MAIGNPNRQTVATAKWQEKAGLINKCFKLKKPLVEAFVDACDQSGRSQASVITELMQQFIAEHPAE